MADINLKFDILKPEYIKAAVKNPVEGELFSDRIWSNKAALADNIKRSLIDAMNGNITIDKIGQNIQSIFNVKAFESQRLVRTENARVQAQAIDDIAENCGIKQQMYCATLEHNTCSECGELDGKYFDLDDESKPDLPLHPNCRCLYINVPYDGWQPTVRKDGELKDIIDYEDYNQWLKDNNINVDSFYQNDIIKGNNYFNDLGLDEVAADELFKIHEELNEFSNQNGIEKLITIDIDGVRGYELNGNKDSVVFSKDLMNFLNNTANNSVILSHNHPSSSAFSPDDLNVMSAYKSLLGITVEGQNGTKYVCKVGNGLRPSKQELFNAYEEIKNSLFNKYYILVKSNTLTPNEAWYQHSNEIMEELSHKYKWIYRRLKP